jgi:hypothetical protein
VERYQRNARILHSELLALATPERAKTNAWYFKTSPGPYGEGERFAGLSLPQLRGLARSTVTSASKTPKSDSATWR